MLEETGKPPNKYTIFMGEQIRKAREEAGLSQEQLAQKTHRKRLAVSEMENGKVEINAWTLIYLCRALNKPTSYFYPDILLKQFPKEDLNPMDHELLLHFHHIWNEDLQKLAIKQVKAIADFDPEEMFIERLEDIKLGIENKEKLDELYAKRPRIQKIINEILNRLFPSEPD